MIRRAPLAGGGVALAVSLFVPWFEGTSGWEHWAWADVILAVLAAALVVAALRPPPAPMRIALVVLCSLGVAVVLGHGFEPRVDVGTGNIATDVQIGPYLALVALAAGAIGAAGPLPLLLAAAGGLVASLFSTWHGERMALDDRVTTSGENGFERWHVLDIALLLLAAGLLVAAAGRAPKALRALLALGSAAAAACILLASDTQFWVGDGGLARGASMGALAALLSLAAALGGLALQSQTSSPDSTRSSP
jgi:hypothetical protein